MQVRCLGVALTIVALSAGPPPLFAACKLLKFAEFPVAMSGTMATVNAKINNTDVHFIVDSGAFFSTLTPAAASQLGLRLRPAPFGLTVEGIAGKTDTRLTDVTLTLANQSIPDVEFLVGSTDFGGDTVGFLGQNVLRIGDVEYDFANGAMRFMRPQDCRHSVLAYWATSQPYSSIAIRPAERLEVHTIGTASVNGHPIRVIFDTGASRSILTLDAAARAGVKPDSPGVKDGGWTYGVGRGTVRTWIAPFASFKIGDEEVRNTHLRIGAVTLDKADMLLGADFFLSHHIYVANSQDKLYFTYNGGPVFNLTSQSAAAQTGVLAEPKAEEPADAAAFSRRGSAFAARHEYERAIADLTRASELDPNEASYFFQRGEARWHNGQPDLAMSDFDQALKLEPDDVPTLTARAELRLRKSDQAGALADLDTADRAAVKGAEVRLWLGNLYERADAFAQAAVQYDLWLATHAEDARTDDAMSQRCWARASSGRDFAQSLKDCESAHKSLPQDIRALNGLALVQLRIGDLEESISTYNAALRLNPKSAWSHYGRGLAELKRGMTSDGQADIAAATALNAHIADEAKKHDMVP